jgi:hypothetical protein
MLRENKGLGDEPRYVCERFKSAADCDAHRVPVRQVEEALTAQAAALVAHMPASDSTLGAQLAALDEELYEASSECEHMARQLAAMTKAKKRIPATFTRHAAALEARHDALAGELRSVKESLAQKETRFVRKRAESMATRVAWYGTDPTDIVAANAALRECFEKVVIDWPRGLLRFYWRHAAPPSEIVFDQAAYAGFADLDAEG